MTARPRVGFIGVGLMGYGMAKNIVEKGYPLTVLAHRNRQPVDDLVQRGAEEAKTAKAIAESCEFVFLCVTGSPQIEAIVRGETGLKSGAHPGLVIIDCSTADPTSTEELARELAPLTVDFIDAPLGGTPAGALEGKLSAMIGSSPEVFARVEPVVATWAAKIEHIGKVGDGHRMKLINNFLSLGYGAIYAEALTLAQKSGLSPQTFDRVLRGSRMDCGFYQTFMKYILEHDRDAHRFTLANAAKDTRYLAAMADAAGMANPIASAVKNTYASALASGRGEDFVPMIADFIAALNGTKLP
jgi:3-hydroxyisobutyrate dehydrogenase-like beta-hydroxyacid dehydrogenase